MLSRIEHRCTSFSRCRLSFAAVKTSQFGGYTQPVFAQWNWLMNQWNQYAFNYPPPYFGGCSCPISAFCIANVQFHLNSQPSLWINPSTDSSHSLERMSSTEKSSCSNISSPLVVPKQVIIANSMSETLCGDCDSSFKTAFHVLLFSYLF